MAGELWRSLLEGAKEVTYGTALPATRQMYPLEASVGNDREGRPKRFAVGARDNVRGFTSGPDLVGGTVRLDMSPDELVEWMLITLQGGVTPTTPATATLARDWTFTPGGTALDSMCGRYNDGARAWVCSGLLGNQLTIEGSVSAESTVSLDLFGKSRVAGALTGGLAQRTPSFLEGWQTNLYIDAFETATPGATQVVNMTAWNVTLNNNLERKFLARNSKELFSIPIGVLDANATLTFEAAIDETMDEYANWDADIPRMVALEWMGPVDGIEPGMNPSVRLFLPGNWTAPNLVGEDAGTRTYEFGLQYRYDPTNGYGARMVIRNGRATAWGAT